MHTYQFAWLGRRRFFDAGDIFDAMAQFHALYSDTSIAHVSELTITKIS